MPGLLRQSIRALRQSPGFAVFAIAVTALGIGATTLAFSLVDAALVRPLPFRDAGRLVVLWESVKEGQINPASYPNFQDWRAQSRSFSELAAYAADDLNLTASGRAERIFGEMVSESYFSVLGVAAEHGRTFAPDDNRVPGGEHVAVLAHGCWRQRFGGDPKIVGRTIRLNEATFTVVGVLPSGFAGFTGQAEVWVPLAARDGLWPQTARFDFMRSRDIHWHRVLGRLAPGVTLETAQAEMTIIGDRLAQADPGANEGRGVRLAPAQTHVTRGVRAPLLVMLGAAGLVLLIACANVANLFLARALSRRPEVALRGALGASWQRLLAERLGEAVAIAAAAGVAGSLLARLGLTAILRFLPVALPSFAEPRIDGRVLAFVVLVVAATGVLLGLLPGVKEISTDAASLLGRRRGTMGRDTRFRGAFVVCEMALSLMLLVGAGLLIETLHRMRGVDPGFDVERLATLRVDVPNNTYEGAARARLGQSLVDAARGVPGIESAAITFTDPFVDPGINLAYAVEGQPPIPPAERDSMFLHLISPDYFRTLGMSLIAGRDFTLGDDTTAPPVAIVSESFARRYWSGKDPIGRRVKFAPDDPKSPWMTVVGVATNVKFRSLRQDVNAESVIYQPNLQSRVVVSLSLVARTALDPQAVLPPLREAVRRIDPEIPVYSAATLNDRWEGERAEARSFAWLMGALAAVASLLAGFGLYAVASFAAAGRVRENGVRVALGARPADIARHAVGEGLRLVALGAVLGLAGAMALGRLAQSILFETSATDPVVYVAVTAFLATIGLAACLAPALRAATTDPVSALRCE